MLDTNSTATALTTPPDEAEQRVAPPGKKRWFARHRFALGSILLISIVMNFYALGKNGFGSYYPAAVRSMLDSWHPHQDAVNDLHSLTNSITTGCATS
jgi:hypothetical protein